MTIRWRINLAVIALVAVFLAAAALSMRAVTSNAAHTREFVRMRELSQFTADVRTLVYARIVATRGAELHAGTAAPENWAQTALEDIDIHIHLAGTQRERKLWESVRRTIADLESALEQASPDSAITLLVKAAERDLRGLRNHYDVAQYDLIASVAGTSFRAQVAMGVACVLTVVLFLLYLFMVRAWLVQPVEVLKASAETIGSGNLDHRVPLKGGDELARLARHIDAMAEGLARHQAALLEARELSAIGELCAHVAHGLRNPLAAIRSTVQLAERQAGGEREFPLVLRKLAQQADLMDQRITRLFEFSKPLQLRFAPTAFETLASAARAQVEALLQSRKARLVIEDRTEGVMLQVDRDRFADALAELVSNAVHHSPQGAEVILRGDLLRPTNGATQRLRIEVTDSGAGMSPATLEKARELFFTTRPEGTGMGLALVQRIIKQHGGELTISSSAGWGTTVSIMMSASGDRAGSRADGSGASPRTSFDPAPQRDARLPSPT